MNLPVLNAHDVEKFVPNCKVIDNSLLGGQKLFSRV